MVRRDALLHFAKHERSASMSVPDSSRDATSNDTNESCSVAQLTTVDSDDSEQSMHVPNVSQEDADDASKREIFASEDRSRDPENCQLFVQHLRSLECVRLTPSDSITTAFGEGVTPLSHEVLLDRVRSGHVQIPQSLASHEVRLLRASTEGEPRCRRGSTCIGTAGYIAGAPAHLGGFVLLPYMNEFELNQYEALSAESKRDATDYLQIQRDCVLCGRHAAHSFVNAIRSTPHTQLAAHVLYQQYRINVDSAEGYKSEHCVRFRATHWEGFCHHIVRSDMHLLRWTQRPGSLVWCVDQSAIMWTYPGVGQVDSSAAAVRAVSSSSSHVEEKTAPLFLC
jgi:hypothetical protein